MEVFFEEEGCLLFLSLSEKFSRNSADREKDPQGGDKIEIEKL